MSAERITLNPITEDMSNAPLEMVGTNNSHGIYLLDHEYPPPEKDTIRAPSADTEGDPAVQNRYRNRNIKVGLRVVEPQDVAATNLITNPKCAVDTTGWTEVGLAIVERIVIDVPIPESSIGADTANYVQMAEDGAYAYISASVVSGTDYYLSAWILLLDVNATGVKLTARNNAGTLKAESSVESTMGEWIRMELPVTPDSSAAWRFGIEQEGAGYAAIYATAWLLEVNTTLGPYFDGDSPGCAWTGTRHASTSTRLAPGGDRFYAIQADLEQLCDRITREGGTYRRTVPDGDNITFDLLDADISITADRQTARKRATVELNFEARPFGRGVETASSNFFADVAHRGYPLTLTISDLAGDVPGLGRLVVDEDVGVTRRSVIWGLRSRYYSDDPTSALFYEAEDLTALVGTTSGSTANDSGQAAGGLTIIANNLSGAWQAILSTQIDATGDHLAHIGQYRVFARACIYLPAPPFTGGSGETVDFAFEWGNVPLTQWTRNDAVTLYYDTDYISLGGSYHLLDLGQINIEESSEGNHAWQGQIIARSTEPQVIGCAIDYIVFIPISEGSGQAFNIGTNNSTVMTAHDEFMQAAGSLTGKTMPLGGTWAGAGDANDFAVTGSPNYLAQRTAVSDGVNIQDGRFAIAGTTILDSSFVQVDVRSSVLDDFLTVGCITRYTDLNNFCVAWWVPKGGNAGVYARFSGVTTTISFQSSLYPGAANTWYTMRFIVEVSGYWHFYIYPAGQEVVSPIAEGYSIQLSPGVTLNDGKCGFWDWQNGPGAVTRSYDNFVLSAPLDNASLFANRSLQISYLDALQQTEDGQAWQKLPGYEGDLLYVPPASREARTVEIAVKCVEGPDTPQSDGSIVENTSGHLYYTPRYLHVPDPS